MKIHNGDNLPSIFAKAFATLAEVAEEYGANTSQVLTFSKDESKVPEGELVAQIILVLRDPKVEE